MSASLAGRRIALVTGAARGIGAAIVDRLIADGLDVIALDLPAAPRPAPHARRTDLDCDLAEPSAVEALAARFERLDVLVNNAGIFARTPLRQPEGRAAEAPILAVNAVAPARLAEAFLPLLARGSAPAVVNVASVRGLTASESAAAYSISKAAVIDLTHRLAREHAPVRCNAVAPGDIRTGMTPELEVLARLLPRIPLGRLGWPEEVANAVAFLASPLSRAVNGMILPVDGGFLCS